MIGSSFNIDDPQDAVARGLRFRRNDRDLLADQCVEQRALARVGASKDTGESRVKGHESLGYSLLAADAGEPRSD